MGKRKILTTVADVHRLQVDGLTELVAKVARQEVAQAQEELAVVIVVEVEVLAQEEEGRR